MPNHASALVLPWRHFEVCEIGVNRMAGDAVQRVNSVFCKVGDYSLQIRDYLPRASLNLLRCHFLGSWNGLITLTE